MSVKKSDEVDIANLRRRFRASEPSFENGNRFRLRMGKPRLAVVFRRGVEEQWVRDFFLQRGVVGHIEKRKAHTYLIVIPGNVRKHAWISELERSPQIRYISRFW